MELAPSHGFAALDLLEGIVVYTLSDPNNNLSPLATRLSFTQTSEIAQTPCQC